MSVIGERAVRWGRPARWLLAALAGTLVTTSCSALQDAPIDWTVSVEIVDVGPSDRGTPGGRQLADLVGSTHCRAWTTEVPSSGAQLLMVQLLLYDKPLQTTLERVRSEHNVQRVVVQSKTGGFVDPPAFDSGQAAERLVRCR